MTEAAEKVAPTRYPVQQIHVSELQAWYDIGWTYVEPAEVPGFAVIKWEQPKPPVAPFKRGELA
ncbi:hypothetical protein LPB73_07430 [Tardiphaga sp. 37S4]|uniref:hypothetical protein n=1 Tax=Tardiphaga sp. 37S4 TaxID=1404741 RepID=UPI001E3AC49C|nr:hypothetical protein [Tardiphaga sp. 37S4]UFS77199.1 hypothetical protein LPB73_07430 [Tardiphaga sp. 37S4]